MISAFISAAVAFIVLAVSQWIIHRRERSRVLLGKLEEMYLVLLEIGKRNMERFEPAMVVAFQKGPIPAKWPLPLEQMLMADLLEKLELLVEFYFPQLQDDLERMFKTNLLCNEILTFRVGQIVSYDEIKEKSIGFAEENAALKRRIISERASLIRGWSAEIQEAISRGTYG